MTPLFDHVTVLVSDVARSRTFYEGALAPFGVRVVQSSQGPIGFAGDARGDFWIRRGDPATPVHLAFRAPDRAAVDLFYAAALAAGGADNGAPGVRARYGPDYYAAYVLDPDGNNVEAVCWAAAASVRELRLCVTADDYDAALRFYRDALGLREREAYEERGRVTILEAGRATLELLDAEHAAFVDEVEVGRPVAGHIRVAFEIDDAAATTERLAEAGATVIADPTQTPWNSVNARLQAPAGLQLTLFEELGE